MDTQEVECGGMKWIGLAQKRDVEDNCECVYEPSVCIKCGELLD
jgi:hypothetical protein